MFTIQKICPQNRQNIPNPLTKRKKCDILTKKMIEAHQNKSICREKARAGVAAKKGFGAEDLPRRRGVLATRITSVLLSQICGVLSVRCQFDEDSRVNGCFLLKSARVEARSSAFLLQIRITIGGLRKSYFHLVAIYTFLRTNFATKAKFID